MERSGPTRQPFSARLTALPRGAKRFLMVAADLVAIPAALWCAFALRFSDFAPDVSRAWWLFPVAVGSAIPIFARMGLYRAIIRYIGSQAVWAVLSGVSVSVMALASAALLAGPSGIPRSVFVIYWALAVLYVAGTRFLMRTLFQRQLKPGKRVAIYGAGGAGARLSVALAGGQEFVPVAFLDDNQALHASRVNGIRVYAPAELPALIERLEIDSVLLALPSVSRRRRHEILATLERLPVQVQTMPNFSDLISGLSKVDEIREVDVEDLLGREAVPPVDELLDRCIRAKCVMVTGAGGSIGSELCRQILRLRPTRIVLLELSELALYNIERELKSVARKEKIDVEIVAILGSAHHMLRVREVVRMFAVKTIYHAAAYKHVPIVEQNMVEGVHNNVFGTYYTAEAAVAGGVETFVLVSTDKAVSPTNVMGATKRFAELVLQGLNQRADATRFCMVRFGNVLESSGSVVPIFRQQIRDGGPVTVTHPEIIRYFMTIPEAAQLVLQAGSMGTGGDVFVLDMGQPVRIADLARRMISLAGLTVRDADNPDGDIEIAFTGLRPAEKLYEELLIGNNVSGTGHPMIMRAEEVALSWPEIRERLDELLAAVEVFDCERAREILLACVNNYRPSARIEDLVFRRSADNRVRDDAKVTPIRPASR